jgi:hypothetical protein
MWEEVGMVYSNVVSQYVHGGTEKEHNGTKYDTDMNSAICINNLNFYASFSLQESL